MKGIILAGGTGSRLSPLTDAGINKHLLPVGKWPMIHWPLQKLVDADITDIMIVVGKEHAGSVINYIGSGSSFGANVTYAIQDRPGGIAEALGLTRGFAYGERVCVILGDNIFSSSITEHVKAYNSQQRGAKVFITEVEDPTRFGVPEISGDRIVNITEKPKEPKSKYAVVGIYMYDQKVFDIIDRLCPSKRGELEITDVSNTYIEWGELTYAVLDGWWTDAGTHESLQRANRLVCGNE